MGPLLFMSTTAVTAGRCYHQSQETVAVERALIEAAARRVLLLDHTKFSKQGLYALAPLTSFDVVLVDHGYPPRSCDGCVTSGSTSGWSTGNPASAGRSRFVTRVTRTPHLAAWVSNPSTGPPSPGRAAWPPQTPR
jgi:hypothetical protein